MASNAAQASVVPKVEAADRDVLYAPLVVADGTQEPVCLHSVERVQGRKSIAVGHAMGGGLHRLFEQGDRA
jgi:hypothetical protein